MPIKKIALCAVTVAVTAAGGLLVFAATPSAQAAFLSSVGGPITRSEVIERAQYWVDHQPGSYNQTAYSPDPTYSRSYRRDCSGYVDMAWHTGSDNWTGNMSSISFQISRSDLKAGDILNDPVNHVILFNAWESDRVHFSYYSFGSTPVKKINHASINQSTIDGHPNSNYIARRYNKIIDSGAVLSDRLYGLSPDRAHVSTYNGNGVGPAAWAQIGGVASKLYAGGDGLFATNPNDGSINRYNGDGGWTRIGGPADSFAVTGNALYGLAYDKSTISVWTGTPGSWTVVGGAATQIYGGGAGLFAVNPNDGSINRYNGSPGSWTRIGGPADSFAVTGNALYGLARDRSTVSVWNGTPNSWTVIGGAATRLYAGGLGLFAVNPNDGSINKYNGTPGSWTRVGGPAAAFAVGATKLYGLAPDKSSVAVWSGNGTGWIGIGGPADSIAAN